uniref:Uncharacterized protein n=1 Tax=Romanomermis culicivorax TaxID=13658 RepID=A0A915HKY9_ROMCU
MIGVQRYGYLERIMVCIKHGIRAKEDSILNISWKASLLWLRNFNYNCPEKDVATTELGADDMALPYNISTTSPMIEKCPCLARSERYSKSDLITVNVAIDTIHSTERHVKTNANFPPRNPVSCNFFSYTSLSWTLRWPLLLKSSELDFFLDNFFLNKPMTGEMRQKIFSSLSSTTPAQENNGNRILAYLLVALNGGEEQLFWLELPAQDGAILKCSSVYLRKYSHISGQDLEEQTQASTLMSLSKNEAATE